MMFVILRSFIFMVTNKDMNFLPSFSRSLGSEPQWTDLGVLAAVSSLVHYREQKP